MYKATTTTSTTTTTQAPPSTTTKLAPPERPLRRPGARRPLRRRRPQHEYYYDDDEYEDDYVEERMNRRRKPNRNRNRRPEYDEYENPPRANYKDEEDDYSYEQRPMHRDRNRNRDAEEDDYDYDRRSYERPRNRKRPSEHRLEDTEERRPYTDGRKHAAEPEKRKQNDRSTQQPVSDDRKGYAEEKVPYDDRRSLGEENDRRTNTHDDRRKLTEDRRTTSDDSRRNFRNKLRPITERRPQYDEDDYDEPPKTKTQSNRNDDFDEKPIKRPAHDSKPEIVPKVRSSSATSSIFNRPRAPPKINRPVPNNEKKKYEYAPPKQEKATTGATVNEDELYDDEYDYEEPAKSQPQSQPEVKHESIESKKPQPSFTSQRDHRPFEKLPNRGEKEEKLPPYNAEIPEEEEAALDIKTKVTSSKPQRSTSPKNEPIQSQRPSKPDFIEMRPKDVPSKQNSKAPIEFNQDEYIPDADIADYSDEEIDEPVRSVEETRKPETVSLPRNEYKGNVRVSEQQSKLSDVTASNHKHSHEQDDRESDLPQPDRTPNVDTSQFKTKFHRLSPPASNLRPVNENYQKSNTEPEERDVYTILSKETAPINREPSGFKPVSFNHEPLHELDIEPLKGRPFIRIMKRPFLPSRGGSPYLPRGLKPVGNGITTAEVSTENTHIGSNQSPPLPSVHLFEHNLPIIRPNFNNAYNVQSQQHPSQQHQHQHQAPLTPQSQQNAHLQSQLPAQNSQTLPQTIPTDSRTTTQPPQIESPRSPLDEIFNSDYDVTLNDALNPTLKPLSQSHESPIGFSLNKYDRSSNPYARSDVTHSSSQYRSTAIQAPVNVQSSRQNAPAQNQRQQYYDEYEY